MSENDRDRDAVVLPALLRAARGSYNHAIRARLVAGGFDDLPRNGPFVLGGMANHGGTARDFIDALGVSKQAASQLVDTLVVRGYLERRVDDGDRRRLAFELTSRGQAAAAAVRDAIAEIDAELLRRLSPDGVAALRAGLWALRDIRADHAA
jgi:DNA-binding MarR family transcriptional regulator